MPDDNWIYELASFYDQGLACVMVTVLENRGSVPRDIGAKMLVTQDSVIASVGGGRLEFKAIEIAREMLEEGENQLKLETFNLSARLGQCCGGITTLSFEPVVRNHFHLALFGAGHVAKALIKIISTLPFQITWIDSRSHVFPEHIPTSVTKSVSDDPVAEISQIPAASYFLVMTHNHQLDFEITRAILKRNDFAYFGLIGSATKCERFRHQLSQSGFSQEVIDKMTCPVGLNAVKGKHPSEIAVSIAAQLIAYYQNQPQHKKISDK